MLFSDVVSVKKAYAELGISLLDDLLQLVVTAIAVTVTVDIAVAALQKAVV